MATFSPQGLMEYLAGKSFHVWIDTFSGAYHARKQGFKEIEYRERMGVVDSIKVLKKTFDDIDSALEYAEMER